MPSLLVWKVLIRTPGELGLKLQKKEINQSFIVIERGGITFTFDFFMWLLKQTRNYSANASPPLLFLAQRTSCISFSLINIAPSWWNSQRAAWLSNEIVNQGNVLLLASCVVLFAFLFFPSLVFHLGFNDSTLNGNKSINKMKEKPK